MASAWGLSWGAAWGNAWGVISEIVAQTYTQEVSLKKWYVRRGKKLHIFNTAQDADQYLESEALAEAAVAKAQKTSRLARKRLRAKVIKALPDQTIDLDLLGKLIDRFSIPAELPNLIAQQDYERVMQIMALAAEMQDEEDVEMLLLF